MLFLTLNAFELKLLLTYLTRINYVSEVDVIAHLLRRCLFLTHVFNPSI